MSNSYPKKVFKLSYIFDLKLSMQNFFDLLHLWKGVTCQNKTIYINKKKQKIRMHLVLRTMKHLISPVYICIEMEMKSTFHAIFATLFQFILRVDKFVNFVRICMLHIRWNHHIYIFFIFFMQENTIHIKLANMPIMYSCKCYNCLDISKFIKWLICLKIIK